MALSISTIIGYPFVTPNCDDCYYPLITKTVSVWGQSQCSAPLAFPPYTCCLPDDDILNSQSSSAFNSFNNWDLIPQNGSYLKEFIEGTWTASAACTNPITVGPDQYSVNGGFVVGSFQIGNTCFCTGPSFGGNDGYWASWKTRVYGPYPKFCVQFAVTGFPNSVTIGGPPYATTQAVDFIYQSYGPISAQSYIDIEPPQTPCWACSGVNVSTGPGGSSFGFYGNGITIGDCSDDDPPP